MASVYTNDLRLEEIGSGEQSGTWGDTTNTNLELIAEAFSFGTEAITTNADTHTTTIADGATDPGRSIYLKYTGTLDSACTITLGPNTVSKVWFIENATSGSQNIIISQGSGANVTIGNGAVKMVYSDGAGSGAAVVDALVDLDLTGTTTVATLTASGVLTANAGVKVDNITIDGTEIDLSSGDLTIDVAGDLVVNADGGNLVFQDGSDNIGELANHSGDFGVNALGQDKDILFKGNDGGSTITALTLDMSEAGAATFNSSISATSATYSSTISLTDSDVDHGMTSILPTSTYAQLAPESGTEGGLRITTATEGATAYSVTATSTTPSTDGNGAVFRFRASKKDGTGEQALANTDDLMTIGNVGVEKVIIKGSGNVILPQTGVLAFNSETDEYIQGGSSIVYIGTDNAQRISIGTDTITIANGTDLATASAGTNNLRLGLTAGDAIASGGNYNVIIGDGAGTALTTGDENVVVGMNAFSTETTGQYCVAIGRAALANQDEAGNAYNTAVGYFSGSNVTTGGSNTFTGALSGDAITTGTKNVAIGVESLTTDTKGSAAVAVGYQALGSQNFTSGTSSDFNYNTGIGFRAGNGVTGTLNTIIGTDAGRYIGSGSNNTVMGVDAMIGNSGSLLTGNNNTTMGFRAGQNMQGACENNTIYGANAGDALTTADNNVAFGMAALGTDTVGENSTAIGYFALHSFNKANLSGNSGEGDTYNTAVGAYSQYGNLTGITNDSFGYGSLDALTSGTGNVSMGNYSMTALLTGSRNVAIGTQSMDLANGSESDCVAIGFTALKDMDGDGSRENTAVGSYAGEDISTGSSNTAIGFKAGGAQGTAATGSGNTSVGRLAGSSLTSGAYNVLIGWGAGDLITTGNNNTCIGTDTGSVVANLTEGDYNVFIGSDTRGPSTGDNSIVLGHAITGAPNDFSFGKASNVVTNDFDTDANWSRSSDERLKKNITDQKLGLDFINDLRTVKYNWKPNHELDPNDSQLAHLYKENEADNQMNTTATMHNFIAQEVKAALDKAGVSDFSGWKEDQYGVQQVSREMFVIPLVKAVQELSAKVTALEARVATLEGE